MTKNTTSTTPVAKATVTGKAKPVAAPTKARFVLIESEAKINAAIASIAKSGAKLDTLVHQAAVSCLKHIDVHHNVTVMTKLVDALPPSARKNAVRDWAIAFGKLGWDETAKCFTYDKAKSTMLEEAMVMPYWKYKAEPEYVPFDINKALSNVLAKAAAAMKHGDKLQPGTQDKLTVLRALVDGRGVHIDTPAGDTLEPGAAAAALTAASAVKQQALAH